MTNRVPFLKKEGHSCPVDESALFRREEDYADRIIKR